ncbi:MAG: orotate phosphoribosyltransferase [Candidatus Methylarchaceae archaeon HK01M]|nr:orotate phosphoribosyltransferase [Candidatus Methylarchaceae archaeon HK01M]
MGWDDRRLELIEELGKVLIKTGALRFGTFKLTSGRMSSYYIDLRIIPSYPEVFSKTIDVFVEALKNMVGLGKFDAIGGIPTAGLTYATAVAYNLKKPFIYVRKETRKHGVLKRVEGLLPPGWRVVILDDLITTGNSILRTAKAIREEGGIIEDALVLIDRMEGGKERLVVSNVKLRAIANITEISDFLYDKGIIGSDERMAIYNMVKSK